MKIETVAIARSCASLFMPLAVAGVLTFTPYLKAAVSTTAYYRLGENDPGATAGQAAKETTTTLAGNVDLHLLGTATYSGETGVTGSQLALQVANGGYTNATPIITAADNWGLEAWVLSDTTEQNRAIVYNGNSANSGMGLYQLGGDFIGLVGGRAFVGSEPIVPGTWTHLALVVANGTSTLYVNGIANLSAGAPAPATGTFHLGMRPDGGEKFEGRIDEVRLFTFEPDQFVVEDLLLTQVPPSQEPPVIVSGPTASPGNQVMAGEMLSLSVVTGGTSPLSYEWRKDGASVSGATNATLVFNPAAVENSGNYAVVVTNPYGAVTSVVAQVTIVPTGSPGLMTQAYYRLGEQDPGAQAGGTAADPTVDSNGTNHLTLTGNPPVYSAETGISGSTLCVALDTGGFFREGQIISQTDNWGIEAWVLSDTTAENRCIAYFGNSANSGMGIYQLGDRFAGLAGSVAVIGGAPVVPGTWTHLAVVTTGGQSTFYVNGTSTGTGGRPNPVDAASATFNLGIKAVDWTEPFVGRIDEVRVFTVLPGHFSSGDLLLSRVPPGALPPFIVSGPTATPGSTVLTGKALTLQVVAGGTVPLQFQWRKAGGDIAGATNTSHTLDAVSTSDSGAYDVVVRNTYGAVTSLVANVTVLPPGTPTVATVAYYRLGEADPGAQAGGTSADPTIDSAGNLDLVVNGNPPTYSAQTGVSGSTLCVNVDAGGYQYDGAILTNAQNWGVEAWVLSDTTAENRSIAYYGSSAGSGMGIYQLGDRFGGLAGGVAIVGGAPVQLGTWTHLAMVVDAGQTTFYVNGISTGTGGRPNPIGEFDQVFHVGIRGDLGEPFIGRIDEVRVFEITVPGQFAPQDLLLTQVPPGAAKPSVAISRSASDVVVTWTAGSLQQADSPGGTWNNVEGATSPWTNTPSANMKFFRAVVR